MYYIMGIHRGPPVLSIRDLPRRGLKKIKYLNYFYEIISKKKKKKKKELPPEINVCVVACYFPAFPIAYISQIC